MDIEDCAVCDITIMVFLFISVNIGGPGRTVRVISTALTIA